MPRAGGLLAQQWGEAIQDAMAKLPQLTIDASEYLLEQLLQELLDDLPPRPPYETAKQQWPGFLTDKQRRWYFWALKSGELARQKATAPRMDEHWGTEVHTTPAGIVGILYSDAPHMPWVVGPDYPGVVYPGLNEGRPMYQARIHQGRWWQLGEFMREKSPELWDELNKRMSKIFDDLFVGPMWA
jgi:hypothetical protein